MSGEWRQLSGTPALILATAAAVAALALVLVTVLVKRRRAKSADGPAERRKVSAGTIVAIVAFVVCTSVSLNTGFNFTGDKTDGLGMTHTAERVLACAAFESLIAMCVLGARERMANPDGDHSPGWYGSAVWIFAGLSSVPAIVEGNGAAGVIVRIIVGSFGSALAAHSALGLELRHRTGAQSQTALAQITRELRERLMACFGLAHRDRTALEIAQDRAMDRAVDKQDIYDRLAKKGGRRGKRVSRRLALWQDRAGLATNADRRDLYRARVAQRRYATQLITDASESLWSQPTAQQAHASQLDELEAHTQTAETLADEAEEALMAQIWARSVPVASHVGTPLPGPRAVAGPETDDEPADCVDVVGDEGGTRTTKAAAAHDTGPVPVVTSRVRMEDDEDEAEWRGEDEPLRALNTYPTKRAALEALYRDKIEDDDPRTTNAITAELLPMLAAEGIKLDRGAANRYLGLLRIPQDQDQQSELACV